MPWRPKRPPFPWRTLLKVLVPIVALVVAFEVVSTVVEQRRPPNQVRRLKERAGLHRQVGQLDEAAAALDQARALDPDDADLPVLLALVRQAQGRPDEAERVLRAARARRPDDMQLTVPLARLLLDTGRPMEAAELLEPALVAIRRVTDPLQRIDALLVAGQAAAGRGALLQAEALFREATRVGPAPVTTVAKGAAEACLALADLYTRTGRLAGAHEALAAARTYTPWDPRIAVARARALELAGQTEEAVAELQPLVGAEAGPDLTAAAGDVFLLPRGRARGRASRRLPRASRRRRPGPGSASALRAPRRPMAATTAGRGLGRALRRGARRRRAPAWPRGARPWRQATSRRRGARAPRAPSPARPADRAAASCSRPRRCGDPGGAAGRALSSSAPTRARGPCAPWPPGRDPTPARSPPAASASTPSWPRAPRTRACASTRGSCARSRATSRARRATSRADRRARPGSSGVGPRRHARGHAPGGVRRRGAGGPPPARRPRARRPPPARARRRAARAALAGRGAARGPGRPRGPGPPRAPRPARRRPRAGGHAAEALRRADPPDDPGVLAALGEVRLLLAQPGPAVDASAAVAEPPSAARPARWPAAPLRATSPGPRRLRRGSRSRRRLPLATRTPASRWRRATAAAG
ncbi:MAG: tetratricopeptide repeat protein [Planctomycetes bacterium]|nr:tetratricopeptide repeat protein [Planctomycetota bacterium]